MKSAGKTQSIERIEVHLRLLQLNPSFPRLHNLSDRFFQGNRNIPIREVRFHLAEIAIIADTVFLEIGVFLGFSGEFLCQFESLAVAAQALQQDSGLGKGFNGYTVVPATFLRFHYPPFRRWIEKGKLGKPRSEIIWISGDETIESGGKSANEEICHRTFGDSGGLTTLNMKVPGVVGVFGVFDCPRFFASEPGQIEKAVLLDQISCKSGG